MKYSKLFGKTVKEAKKDMKLASHRLLYQAGFIRELSAGRYEYLPLGFRVWQKMVNIIDKEMEAIGSQRMSIPVLQPIEFWQKTNRDSVWGASLMKIKDRNDAEFALSATGEGIVTEMVGDTKPSYKDLPIIVHQFIVKFRDEMRPRGGLLRVREFVMKDAYSYHRTEEDMMKTYQDFYDAYARIAKKLNFEVYPCIADSGALGGDYCHEFQVVTEAGEDTIVVSEDGKYAANVEKAVFKREEVNMNEEMLPFEEVDLPTKVATIPQLVKHYDMPAERFIKNVVYKANDGTLVIATVTGNLDVNDVKLSNAVGKGDLEKAIDEDLESIGSKSGFVHSWGYEEHKDRIIFVADESITKARNLYGGFKTETTDPINVNYGRDFESDIVADIAEAYEGAEHPEHGKLKLIRTAEFGHVFKYDHFYTKKHGSKFTDEDGENKFMYMGAYGIGIGRAIALSVETNHDDNGIIWPKEVAPFHVHLVTIAKSEEDESYKKSKEIYDDLNSKGVEVLWDDRIETRPGEKFADSDLIGIPIRAVVSSRSLENGGVEIKLRSEGDNEIISIDKLDDFVNKLYSSKGQVCNLPVQILS